MFTTRKYCHILITVALFGLTVANICMRDKMQKMQNRAARIITGRPYEIATK